MALVIDNNITKNITNPSGATAVTFNHAQPTGADGHLFILISRTTESDKTPNSVTYNGVTMTKAIETSPDSQYSNRWLVYELDTPATGSNQVSINFTQFDAYGAMYTMVISATGCGGLGQSKFTDSVFGDLDIDIDLPSVSTGSTTVLSMCGVASDTHSVTIDGTIYPSAQFEWEYTINNANIQHAYKEGVSTRFNSATASTSQMAGFAFEIKAGAAPITIPTLNTTTITNINATNADSGGNTLTDGGGTISAKGVCWVAGTGTPTIGNSKTTDGTGTGNFSSDITPLSANSQYSVRAYATNTAGTGYGGKLTFTTDGIVPTVTTQAVSSIDITTATGNGNVTSLGVPNPTQHGVCWNTGGAPTTGDSKTTDGAVGATGAFTSSITGLTESQLYFVRAYATNTEGTVYGGQVSFTTLATVSRRIFLVT